ncbi:hypothetical protein TI04_02990, partial [Achromatium sp. WMS2]
MSKLTHYLLYCSFLLCLIIPISSLAAEDDKPLITINSSVNSQPVTANSQTMVKDISLVTTEQVGAARTLAEADASLSTEDKKKLLELYEQIQAGVKKITTLQAQASTLDNQILNAPQRIAEIKQALRNIKPPTELDIPAAALKNLEQIELFINQQNVNLAENKENLRLKENQLSELLVGSRNLTADLASKIRALEQLDKEITASGTSVGETTALQQANTWALQIRRQVLSLEIDILKKRLGSILLTELTQNERDLLAAKITQTEQFLVLLKGKEQLLQSIQAAVASAQAISDVNNAKSQLSTADQAAAEATLHCHKELETLVAKDQGVNSKLLAAGQSLEVLKSDLERIRQRVEVAGLNRAIGRMLRQRRENLPSFRDYNREAALRSELFGQAVDRQMEIDDLLHDIPLTGSSSLQAYRAALNELQKVYSRYLTNLASLDIAEHQLVEVSTQYISYIDDKLIWIPSAGLISLFSKDSNLIWDFWLLQPANWVILAQDFGNAITYWPIRILAISILLIGASFYRKQFLLRMQEISQATRKIRTDSFVLSMEALILTLLLALPWPLVILGIGYILSYYPTTRTFSSAIGTGLLDMGLLLISLNLVRVLCYNDGVGDRHFRWSESLRMTLRKNISWFMPLAAPLSFLVAATTNPETPLLTQTIGILAFTILMLAVILLLWR